jgi:hypothetical protein
MSAFDKFVAAVTPPETEEQRAEARSRARAAAEPGDWLSMILDHHEEIEQAFAAVKQAPDAQSRREAEEELGILLTGHAIAEEAVIYPGVAHGGEKGAATMAYTEQAAAKMQLAALAYLDPMSEDYLDKLGHLEGAVAHHVFEEESKWFLELKEKAPADEQDRLTSRYEEEFERYMGSDADDSDGLYASLTEGRTFESGAS